MCVLDYSTVMIWLILFAFAYFVKSYEINTIDKYKQYCNE